MCARVCVFFGVRPSPGLRSLVCHPHITPISTHLHPWSLLCWSSRHQPDAFRHPKVRGACENARRYNCGLIPRPLRTTRRRCVGGLPWESCDAAVWADLLKMEELLSEAESFLTDGFQVRSGTTGRRTLPQSDGGKSFTPKHWIGRNGNLQRRRGAGIRCRDYLNRCCEFSCSLNPKYCHSREFLVLTTVNVRVYGHIYIEYHIYSVYSAPFTALTDF